MGQPYKSFTLVPKQGHGIITSRSPQVLAEYTDSLTFLQNLLVKDGAWVARGDDTTSDLIGASSGPVYGIHYYNAIDPTNAAATPVTTFLVHAGQATNETGTSTLRRSDTGAIVTVNGVNFTTTTPSDIFFLNINNRCFVAGTKMGTSVVPTIITRYPSQTSYMWGVNAPTADMTYDAFTNVTNANTKLYFTANGGTIVGAPGSSNSLIKAGGANWDTAWAGKTVLIDGEPYDIVSVAGVGGPMVINPNFAGAAGTYNIRVQYGEVSWPNGGPTYAYAYRNPSTGHFSSVSPYLTISEQSMKNVRVKLSGIVMTNDPNYTEIVLFRTDFDNGGILRDLKLDVAAPVSGTTVNANGTLVNGGPGVAGYTDYVSSNQLGKIVSAAMEPTRNNPPPADTRYMAYWDERVWVVSASSRNNLYFSGNATDIPLGRPEESFPALFFRPVPSDDGFITGLKVVGTSLLVCTERYLYFVSGSSADTYRLVRISSRGSGVDQYAIDEHPGDSSDQSASAIYISRDKRLWRQYPGGRVEDIGWPVQDKLDSINLNLKKPVVIRVCQVLKSWFLVVGIRESSPARYGYMFYDFDEQAWIDLNMGTPAMWGVGYGGYTSPWWSGIAAGVVYDATVSGTSALDIGGDDSTGIQRLRLMGNNVNGMEFSVLDGQHLDCGDKQGKKTFQELIIHTDETDTSKWQVAIQCDGAGTTVRYLTAVPNTTTATSPRYMGTQVMRYVLPASTGPTQYHTIMPALLGGFLSPGKHIFKVVINYTPESTGISGSTA